MYMTMQDDKRVFTPREIAIAQRQFAIMNVFSTIGPPLSLHYVRAFLAVAAMPGLGTSEYARLLELDQAVTSRILLEIGKKTRKGDPGRDLVEAENDEVDLRKKHYYLTHKGREVFDRIMELY
jgi:DNA-binding MarR family transcriptional regulator